MLPAFGASIVMGALGGQIAKVPQLQKIKGAMKKAGQWVQKAADLDPEMHNVQAHLMQLSLQFAQAMSAARLVKLKGGKMTQKQQNDIAEAMYGLDVKQLV